MQSNSKKKKKNTPETKQNSHQNRFDIVVRIRFPAAKIHQTDQLKRNLFWSKISIPSFRINPGRDFLSPWKQIFKARAVFKIQIKVFEFCLIFFAISGMWIEIEIISSTPNVCFALSKLLKSKFDESSELLWARWLSGMRRPCRSHCSPEILFSRGGNLLV